jgi:hypothetical protein
MLLDSVQHNRGVKSNVLETKYDVDRAAELPVISVVLGLRFFKCLFDGKLSA